MDRTRTRGGFSPIVGSGYWRYFDGSGGETNYYSDPVGSQTVTSDVVTPGFAKRSARGEIINNPYTSTRNTVNQSGLTVEWSSVGANRLEGWVTLPYKIVLAGFPFLEGLTDTLAHNHAVNAANANVTPNDAMLLVAGAELGKTADMVRGLGGVVNNFSSAVWAALRRTKNSRSRNIRDAQAIADAWFTTRYGILPTVSDLNGSIKALRNQWRYNERVTARGSATVSDSNSGVLSAYWRGPVTSQWTVKRNTVYRAGVLYEPTGDLNSQLATSLGLSVTDLVPTAYELVPFSFVLDWAFDVGTWLRAVSPKPGARCLSSWTTVEQTATFDASPSQVSVVESGWTGGGGGGHYMHEIHVKSRSPSATPTAPGYGSGLSFNKSLDIALFSFRNCAHVLSSIGR